MVRSVWMRRVMAAAAAVLFVLGSAGDVFGRHPCPHHDGPLAAQLDRSAGEAEAHGAAHGGVAQEEGVHGCTCVGSCVGAAGIALPAADAVPEFEAPAGERVHEAARDAEIARKYPSYFLPWSNGPPNLF